ncbi:hypothetical protein T265_15017, partial [Opisthorchis viverrini]
KTTHKLLKTLRQPTTGFAILGAHQRSINVRRTPNNGERNDGSVAWVPSDGLVIRIGPPTPPAGLLLSPTATGHQTQAAHLRQTGQTALDWHSSPSNPGKAGGGHVRVTFRCHPGRLEPPQSLLAVGWCVEVHSEGLPQRENCHINSKNIQTSTVNTRSKQMVFLEYKSTDKMSKQART